MPDFSFQVESAEAVPFAVAPQLAFKLRIRNADPAEQIHTALLRCQIRIEPARRRYQAGDQEGLRDLFGEPQRWSQTLRSMLWAHTTVVVPAFTGSVVVDVPVPCSYDFNVAATKYFHALEEGEVPLLLLFSGTIFYFTADAAVQVAQIPWDREAAFRLPVQVWREMMDHYYPNTAWLNLHKDAFERLYRYKTDHGLPTWEQALDKLLTAANPEEKL
jgi:hypothetical protein